MVNITPVLHFKLHFKIFGRLVPKVAVPDDIGLKIVLPFGLIGIWLSKNPNEVMRKSCKAIPQISTGNCK